MSVLSAVAGQIITTYSGALGGISIPVVTVAPFDNIVFKIILRKDIDYVVHKYKVGRAFVYCWNKQYDGMPQS